MWHKNGHPIAHALLTYPSFSLVFKIVHFCFLWMSCGNVTSILTTFCSFRFICFTALCNSWVCVTLLELFCQREFSVLERGGLWEPEGGNLVWVFQDFGRGYGWSIPDVQELKLYCLSLQLFGVWTESCQTSNTWSFEYGRYVHMIKHPRFLKRWLDLVLCQQPISHVFTSVSCAFLCFRWYRSVWKQATAH